MARYVQTYQTHTPGDGTESSLSWESRPYGYVAEHDDPTFHNIETGIVAAGTTSQANSYGLTKAVSVIGTCGANNGVRLPVGAKGSVYIVRNGGLSTCNVYPATDGTINGGSANAAITLATTKTLILFATAANTWYSLPGA